MTCVFCPDNWANLDIVSRHQQETCTPVVVLNPLDPVVPGHVLVVSSVHTNNAAAGPFEASRLMVVAAQHVAKLGIQANIITSIGPAATQTVFHTHVHIVPRVEGDGLPLPWTPQHEAKALAERRRKAEEALWL